MLVIRFDPNLANFLIHGDKRYLLIFFDFRPFLIKNNCPHRGGPLHLGNFDCQKNAFICPWHESAISISRLQKYAMPLVWRKDIAVAVLPQSNSKSVVIKHRHILATSEI